MDNLAYNHVECNYLAYSSKYCHHSCQKKPVNPRDIFNKAPVCRIAIAMNTNSAFTGFHTSKPIWHQQFDPSQGRIFRSGRPFVDIDAADKCCEHVTTIKTTNL